MSLNPTLSDGYEFPDNWRDLPLETLYAYHLAYRYDKEYALDAISIEHYRLQVRRHFDEVAKEFQKLRADRMNAAIRHFEIAAGGWRRGEWLTSRPDDFISYWCEILVASTGSGGVAHTTTLPKDERYEELERQARAVCVEIIQFSADTTAIKAHPSFYADGRVIDIMQAWSDQLLKLAKECVYVYAAAEAEAHSNE